MLVHFVYYYYSLIHKRLKINIKYAFYFLCISGWRFGAIMCKAVPFLQGVAVSASVSTLAAISIDR